MSDTIKMLHTVNKSPFERNALESCLRLAKAGSGVLLIEDGVYGALAGTQASDMVSGKTGDLRIFVLGPDLKGRGLEDKPLIDGIEVVDYGGFVDPAAEHDAVQSWL